MAPPPYPLHPDVSQPGSFCLRAVSQQNICKSMCGNWKSPVYNSSSPSPFSQMSPHNVEMTLRKINQWEIMLGKSQIKQFSKFLSFLRDVTTTGIESPTAAKMSQPKTISHKVFPIPHYLTTWPPDYLTIWRLFDYLVTGWRELEVCKRRGGFGRGQSDYPAHWLTPSPLCNPSSWFSYKSAHFTMLTPIFWFLD